MRLIRAHLFGPLLGVASLLAFAALASAQELGGGAATEIPWWRVVGSLVACLIVAALAAIALKAGLAGGMTLSPSSKAGGRWTPRTLFQRPDRRIKTIESARLSTNLEVCLFVVDDDEFLVAATPGGPLLLRQRPAPQKQDQAGDAI